MWTYVPDAIVIDHLRRLEFSSLPDQIDSVEWDLVLSLCVFEPSKRVILASVMTQIPTVVSERITSSFVVGIALMCVLHVQVQKNRYYGMVVE